MAENKHTMVAGYKGLYEIDEFGNVYSICHNWRGYGKKKMGTTVNSHGYLQVRLTKNGKRKAICVHNLMCLTFIGNKNGLQIRHIDGIKINNFRSNLKLGTAMENAEDREKHGNTSRGKEHSTAIKIGINKSPKKSGRPWPTKTK